MGKKREKDERMKKKVIKRIGHTGHFNMD